MMLQITTQMMMKAVMIHHKNILITGIGGPAGRSAVTYFKAKSFPVIGTEVREIKSPVDSFFIVPQADDLNFTAILMDIIKKERPSLLIPTVTEELPVISAMRKEIEWEGCNVLISSPTAIDIANDRLKTLMIMAGHGIAVPKYCDEVTPADIIVDKLGFPLRSRSRFSKGGNDDVIYRRYEDLFNRSKDGLIFQEDISGTVYNLNMFIDKGGAILSAVVLEMTVMKNVAGDSSMAVERVERPDVVKAGTKAAGILNLEGPIDMDIIFRDNFTPVLLNINARLGSNVLFAWEILDCLFDAWKRSLLTGSYR